MKSGFIGSERTSIGTVDFQVADWFLNQVEDDGLVFEDDGAG